MMTGGTATTIVPAEIRFQARDPFAPQVGKTRRDRLDGVADRQHDGPEVVVPDEGEDQDGKSCQCWPDQRHDDMDQRLKRGRAFRPRRLEQLVRKCRNEVVA